MSRPVVALGLIAVALGLLATVFADLGQEVEDPRFEVSDKAAQKALDLAAKDPARAAKASADLMQLLEGAEITLPEGTEIDGSQIKIPEDMDWTLPPGTELQNIDFTIPPDVGFSIPEGTTVDGDALLFPGDSEIRLADGTVLELPEGGRLTMPGLAPEELATAVATGYAITQDGSRLTAPKLRNEGEWTTTLPAGTKFTLPEGYSMEDGVLTAPKDLKIPEGTTIRPASQNADEQGGSNTLFKKIGSYDLTPDSGKTGINAPGIPGGTWWIWVLGSAALLAVAYLAWRRRDLLARVAPMAATLAPKRPPVRLVWRIDGRPEGLPIALAPGDESRLFVRLESRETSEQGEHWQRIGGRLEIVLDGAPHATVVAPPEGMPVPLAVLPPGDHALEVRVQSEGKRRAHGLTETIRVAPWAEQVARDYQALYDRLSTGVRTGLPDAYTPRLLAAALRRHLSAADDDVDRFILVFERANYSQDPIGVQDWITFAVGAGRYADEIERRLTTPEPKATPQAARGTIQRPTAARSRG